MTAGGNIFLPSSQPGEQSRYSLGYGGAGQIGTDGMPADTVVPLIRWYIQYIRQRVKAALKNERKEKGARRVFMGAEEKSVLLWGKRQTILIKRSRKEAEGQDRREY